MAFASGFFKPGLWPYVLPVLLLICSNIFMTLAWYGHLKYKTYPL
ncbi:MAG: DMT family protein, partial [Methyloceanibacter sp.]